MDARNSTAVKGRSSSKNGKEEIKATPVDAFAKSYEDNKTVLEDLKTARENYIYYQRVFEAYQNLVVEESLHNTFLKAHGKLSPQIENRAATNANYSNEVAGELSKAKSIYEKLESSISILFKEIEIPEILRHIIDKQIAQTKMSPEERTTLKCALLWFIEKYSIPVFSDKLDHEELKTLFDNMKLAFSATEATDSYTKYFIEFIRLLEKFNIPFDEKVQNYIIRLWCIRNLPGIEISLNEIIINQKDLPVHISHVNASIKTLKDLKNTNPLDEKNIITVFSNLNDNLMRICHPDKRKQIITNFCEKHYPLLKEKVNAILSRRGIDKKNSKIRSLSEGRSFSFLDMFKRSVSRNILSDDEGSEKENGHTSSSTRPYSADQLLKKQSAQRGIAIEPERERGKSVNK